MGINFTLACRWAFPYDQGGVAMYNYYLLQLLQNKMDVSLVSSKNEENHSLYNQMGISYTGISASLPEIYWSIAKNEFIKNGFRCLQDWRISLAMAKVLEFESPHIIEFMDIHSDGYAFLKRNHKKYRNSKVIVRSHTPWGLLRSYYSAVERQGVDGFWAIERENYCFQSCDAITTPSQDLKINLIKQYEVPKEKITVIPNIVDTEHFIPLPKNSENQPFTILHVGRFERAKGVVTIIKAFIDFAKVQKDCILINVGQPRGSAYEDCHELLKSANMVDKVKFTGFISYKELPRYYANADVVIVASEIYESFSYTVAQAMACGKAVIASEIGGIPETLDYGKNGKLFKPGDQNSLYNQLEDLLIDEKQRIKLGENARLYAENNFSITALQNRYIDFYQSLIN
jgi:glycosyltransferase involved in cell wall biosynthesis